MIDNYIEAPWLIVLIAASLMLPVVIWYEARGLADDDDEG